MRCSGLGLDKAARHAEWMRRPAVTHGSHYAETPMTSVCVIYFLVSVQKALSNSQPEAAACQLVGSPLPPQLDNAHPHRSLTCLLGQAAGQLHWPAPSWLGRLSAEQQSQPAQVHPQCVTCKGSHGAAQTVC